MVDAFPRVIIDASVVFHAFINRDTPQIRARLRTLRSNGTQFHVPALWRFEITNALHRSTRAGMITSERRDQTLAAAWALPIVYHDEIVLHQRAAEIALALGVGAAYDALYLALSERLNIQFYTCDRRLYSAGRSAFPQMEFLPIA